MQNTRNKRYGMHALVALLAALLGVLTPSLAAANQLSETRHGAWTLRCEATQSTEASACIIFQNLVLKTGGQTVLQFAIGIAPGSGTPTVLISLPLGIALPPGITIQIDAGKPATFPVERCEPDGCQAGMKLRDATIAQLRAGKGLEITFFDGMRQAIRMPLSLDGFSAGYAALHAASAAATAASSLDQ